MLPSEQHVLGLRSGDGEARKDVKGLGSDVSFDRLKSGRSASDSDAQRPVECEAPGACRR